MNRYCDEFLKGTKLVILVVSSLLVFDIIRIALERLNESDVEVLLKILRGMLLCSSSTNLCI